MVVAVVVVVFRQDMAVMVGLVVVQGKLVQASIGASGLLVRGMMVDIAPLITTLPRVVGGPLQLAAIRRKMWVAMVERERPIRFLAHRWFMREGAVVVAMGMLVAREDAGDRGAMVVGRLQRQARLALPIGVRGVVVAVMAMVLWVGLA
jgi:hypothetical protein